MSMTISDQNGVSKASPESPEKIARRTFTRFWNISTFILWAALFGHGTKGYNEIRGLSKAEFPMEIGKFTLNMQDSWRDGAHPCHILKVRSNQEGAPEIWIVLGIFNGTYVRREFYLHLLDDTLAFLGNQEEPFSSSIRPFQYPDALHFGPTLDEQGRQHVLTRFTDMSQDLEKIFPAMEGTQEGKHWADAARRAEETTRATNALMNF